MAKKTVKQIIAAAQKHEDANLRRRRLRVLQMMKRYGPLLLDFELRQIETALAPALGRIVMEA